MTVLSDSDQIFPKSSSDNNVDDSAGQTKKEEGAQEVSQPLASVGPERLISPEQQPQSETITSIEKSVSPEVQKAPEAPSLNEQLDIKSEQKKETITSLDDSQADNPNIVDKTDEVTQTHTLKKTGDKLTKEADEEEEHFIEEVEKHHGHL